MKRLIRWWSVISLILICSLGFLGWAQPAVATMTGRQTVPLLAVQTTLSEGADEMACPELEQKIDLNNAKISAFTNCQGFYPNLAVLIVQNGPYDKVEDVLKIPDLSDRQKALLKAQLKNFTVTPPRVPLDMRMPDRSTSPFMG